MAQLARGAGAALDAQIDDLRSALSAIADAHEAVKRNPELARDHLGDAASLIRTVVDDLDTDIRDRLRRAESRQTQQQLIEDLLARVARLEQADA